MSPSKTFNPASQNDINSPSVIQQLNLLHVSSFLTVFSSGFFQVFSLVLRAQHTGASKTLSRFEFSDVLKLFFFSE